MCVVDRVLTGPSGLGMQRGLGDRNCIGTSSSSVRGGSAGEGGGGDEEIDEELLAELDSSRAALMAMAEKVCVRARCACVRVRARVRYSYVCVFVCVVKMVAFGANQAARIAMGEVCVKKDRGKRVVER